MTAALRPLSATLRLAASEAAELAGLADHLEQVAHYSGDGGGRLVEQRQLADLLTQRLCGLTTFLSALASQTPEGASVDLGGALASLRLAAQASRFAGDAPLPDPPASGDVLLFED